MDRLPITSFHRGLIARLGAGLFVDGFDVYAASAVAAALLKAQIASMNQVAALVSFTFIGLAIGGSAAGVVADRLGRRRVLVATLTLVIVGSLGAATSTDMQQLIAWRVLTAMGLGGETVLAYATALEFVPPSVRGRWLAGLGLIANVAIPAALAAGVALSPLPQGWRWMLVIPGVAAVIVLYLRRRLPESPRWLASRGRVAEAERVVAAIERTAPDSQSSVVWPEQEHGAGVVTDGRAPQLFGRENRRNLVVGSAINVGVMSAIFGFISWLPSFFAQEGHDVASSLGFSTLMALGSPIGVLFGLMISDRIERKVGITVFSVAAALLGLIYASAASAHAIAGWGFLVVMSVYLVGTLGMTAYVPELFPTAVRMSAVGFCTTIGRITAIGMPFLVVGIFSRAGQAGVVALIAAILLGQALLVGTLGIRTNRRSLESL
jgi:putative MFS transporter